MPGIVDTPGNFVQRFKIDAEATAGTADTWPLCVVDALAATGWTITGVNWIPNAIVTGAATNNFALGLVDVGAAGAGTQAITTVKTYASGTNSVANVAEALPLSATAANLLAVDGDVLVLARTVNGTGLASPRGTLEVLYRYR